MDNNTETMDDGRCTANIEGPLYVLFVILNIFSGCVAILGNVMVLVAVFKTESLHTVSNFFICSLALADFLVGLLINPLYIAIVTLRVWVSNHPLYKAENYLWIQSLTVTTFSLAAISIDRYIAIKMVFRYGELMTEKRCAKIIGSIWVFSAIFALTALFVTPEDASNAWFACALITVGIPLAIMAYCYYHIFAAARRQSIKIAIAAYSETKTAQMKDIAKNSKAARTVAIVIGCFVCLLTPNMVCSFVEIATEDHCQKLTVYRYRLWAIWLAFSSSACNPWVYAIRSREYRAAYRKIWDSVYSVATSRITK